MCRTDNLISFFLNSSYTVPKTEAVEFTKEVGLKVENHALKVAVEKALIFLDRDELPPHWDREQLFCKYSSDESDSDAEMDSDVSIKHVHSYFQYPLD